MMIMSTRIIKNEWTKSILKPCNPWVGTALENLYWHGSKKRGTYYEKYIARPMLEDLGFTVTNAETSTSPYDLIIENPTSISIEGTNKDRQQKKIEVKVSMSGTDHEKGCVDNLKCIINHVAKSKDFDILLLIFMILEDGESKAHVRWCNKSDIVNHIDSPNSLFKKQQGGKKADNDDWICSSKASIQKLLEDPSFKTIETLESVF